MCYDLLRFNPCSGICARLALANPPPPHPKSTKTHPRPINIPPLCQFGLGARPELVQTCRRRQPVGQPACLGCHPSGLSLPLPCWCIQVLQWLLGLSADMPQALLWPAQPISTSGELPNWLPPAHCRPWGKLGPPRRVPRALNGPWQAKSPFFGCSTLCLLPSRSVFVSWTPKWPAF